MRTKAQTTKAEAAAPSGRPTKAPPITSPQLAKAIAHPIRMKLMAALTMTTGSPSQLAVEIGEQLNLVSYHIKRLEAFGCVELVETRPGRGSAAEHIYRGVVRPYMSLEAWNGLDEVEKHKWVMADMRLITEDIEKAMAQGTFLDPDDNHLSRSPMVVDAQGWAETIEILDSAVEELLEVQTRSAVRLAGASEGEIFQKVAIIQFRSPHRV